MSRVCPSIVTAELPHYTPSTTNNFGSVYDVTYIAPACGEHKFVRPKTSGYARNANGFQSGESIDFNRASWVGRGAGNPAPGLLSRTAHARSSCGPHSLGDEPFGTTEHKDRYQSPRGAPAAPWRPTRFAGADLGEGAAACIRGDGGWSPTRAAPVPKLPPAALRPKSAHAHNAAALHTTGAPLDSDTTNATYGKTAAAETARARTALPMFCWGENARERLYSNSVQKCERVLGIRQLPEDEFNPIRLSRAQAERCRISHRLEHEGWVKNNSVAMTSSVQQQLYPETEGLHRSRAVNAPSRVAARGGNSNAEMYGEVQARAIFDESMSNPSATVGRLQARLDERVSTLDRHSHRAGFSAFSAKFRR